MRKQDGRFNTYPSRNLLINGDMRVDQRGKHGAGAVGEFAFDRWKITTATDMTQIVEDGSYKPATVYTLSGDGVTTQQVTSPASGHWTIPNIPLTARNVQLEEGSVATEFERLPISLTEALCHRYFIDSKVGANHTSICEYAVNYAQVPFIRFPTDMRKIPTMNFTDISSLGMSGTLGAIHSSGASIDGFGITFKTTGSTIGHAGKITFKYAADAEL